MAMVAFQTRFSGRLSATTAILLIANIVYSTTSSTHYSGVAAATSNSNSNSNSNYAAAAAGGGALRSIAGNGNSNLRLALPRTSASQINSGGGGGGGGGGVGGGGAAASFKLAAKTLNSTRNGNLRTREQQLLSIFEIIITTLEGKLKRIDNLGRSVEDLMGHIETLEHRVTNNVEKTEEALSKLSSLDSKLSNVVYILPEMGAQSVDGFHVPKTPNTASTASSSSSPTFQLDSRLVKLDQKVSDIDSKLEVLKTQIDNNFLQVDDFNAEASEKKPITMNVVEITKAMTAEVMSHVSTEVNQLRDSTDNIDKKLQFHINIESENIGRMLRMMNDIHDAVVDHHEQNSGYNVTTTAFPAIKSSKIDALVKQMRPMVSVSEKMDEVWDVVVGTKSSVDHLLPKSDALLTQTQRQERAIGEIHQDLKAKTNLIINNLDMVEKRLKKQEDDVQVLAQRPSNADLLGDPTIDRLVEYDPSRYSVLDETLTDLNEPPTTPSTTARTTATTASNSSTTAYPTLGTPTPAMSTSSQSNSFSSNINNILGFSSNATLTTAATTASWNATPTKSAFRKGGIIFPSVKNKPAVVNNTFTSDIFTLKDVKGFSCVDILNAGMKQSGVFYLQIRGTTYWFLKVYCEQNISDGGWTVIQRRDDFGEPRENFNRDWADYKNGFGEPAKEFWLGNENIYMLTNNEEYALRVELEDFEGNKRYAQYSHFKIHSEADYYKLEIDGYEGNAGDSLNDPWYGSNNSPFSTYNKDNDRSSLNCASMLKGGWWWKSCGRGLNGLYLHDPQDLTARQGIVWFRWRGWDYTLKKATMMIRPRMPQPQSMTLGPVTAT
ncbi:fibrinogen alpha chain [Drosophila sulfurigaster albostrigata]|uniref:fibrinogen alpha chain n=1 Tax=Drosophila sulfurigaster albostrigata TaxID=89887 RepID=UPI002D21DCEF|nr:fibrinogen alpha chain [Drosophila sulfurigaster albostrigata]